MKANEFIKEYGLDEVKHLLSTSTVANDNKFSVIPYNPFIGIPIDIDDLKRLVESHYLVRDLGGVKVAKEMYEIIKTCRGGDKLKQAIADVESCQ